MKHDPAALAPKNGEPFQESMTAMISYPDIAVILVDVRGFMLTSCEFGKIRRGSNVERLTELDLRVLLNAEDILKFDRLLNSSKKSSAYDSDVELLLRFETKPQRFLAKALRDRHGDTFGALLVLPEQSSHASDDEEDSFRWKVAVECADQCVWDHDFEKGIHFVSDSYRKMRGWPHDRPLIQSPENWLESLHPDDLPLIQSETRRIELGETDQIKYEFRQRHEKGHWIWILARGRVTRRDENGKPVRITGIDLDITEMKAQEDERNRIGERLTIAMTAANMAQWEMKLGAETTYWDNRALEIFGINDGQNIRPIDDFENAMHPGDREITMAQWETCMASKSDVACDFRIITPAGDERYIRTRGSFIDDNDGGGRYCGVNIDLTDDHKKTISLEKIQTRLEFESRHDPLTGVANRRQLDDAFSALKADGIDNDIRIAAMHIDVDNFKLVNDTMGHGAGDAILQHIAQTVKKMMPSDALVSRFGGDEFAVLFSEAPAEDVLCDLAKGLIQTLARAFHYEGNTCNTGVSIGIATSRPDSRTTSTLLTDADLALYHAKHSGRGTFSVYDPQMRLDALGRQTAQRKLRAAFENGELVCHYQPQFDAVTGELAGLEALVRWQSPEEGLLMPAAFLGTAEEIGLSAAIDECVLKQALSDLDEWESAGWFVPRVSTNVSAQRLADPTLKDALQKLEIPKNKIAFELVESTFLDIDDDAVTANLETIRSLGIDIEIDDFGTGHTSIVGLLRVAPSRLKIDRELVSPILNSAKMKDLLEALIGIGKMLDIRVVAEGVETKELVPILTEMGCDYLQGYALGLPMPSESIVKLLEKRRMN